MDQAEFSVVVKDTIIAIENLLRVKGGEYTGSTDRLANFKRGASLTGCTPLQCLFIYLSKHYDAVATFVRDDAQSQTRERSEPIDGRLDDIINYCLLAKALIKEKQDADKNRLSGGSGTERSSRLRPGDGVTGDISPAVSRSNDASD